jgi:hypothetical protein
MFPFQRLDNVYGYLLDYDSQMSHNQEDSRSRSLKTGIFYSDTLAFGIRSLFGMRQTELGTWPATTPAGKPVGLYIHSSQPLRTCVFFCFFFRYFFSDEKKWEKSDEK